MTKVYNRIPFEFTKWLQDVFDVPLVHLFTQLNTGNRSLTIHRS